MDQRQPCVYMLASQRNRTLYIGVTSNLVNRIWQHRNEVVAGFTSHYRIHDLVWYELHETMESAILREKQLQGMETCQEAAPDRRRKPRMVRSLSNIAVTG